MAYTNENGQITIDEEAAERDVRRLKSAQETLRNVKSAFNQLQNQAGGSQGETAQAVAEKSSEMINKLNKAIDQMQDLVDYIRRVERKYKQIDADLKAQVESSV